MGGRKSTPAAPPPLLDRPWRQISWGDKQSALQDVNNYKPQTEDLQLRILLYGQVGAGKSSFINSVQSVLQNKMCRKAVVANSAHDCCTKKYQTYRIEKGSPNSFYPFVLNDMMGLKYSTNRNRRVHVKHVQQVMKGRVRDGYTFNPECKLLKEDRHYNTAPTTNDKVHVLVCVFDANKVSLMTKDIVEAIEDIRYEASDLGVPQVAILTKIDEACPEIKQDVKNVYRSKKLKSLMEQFSAEVGIPMYCIFPVKNYHEENMLNDDTDSLLLSALKEIIDIGGERISNSKT